MLSYETSSFLVDLVKVAQLRGNHVYKVHYNSVSEQWLGVFAWALAEIPLFV